MNCNKCKSLFSPRRVPRILLGCGHSMCEVCVQARLGSGEFACCECKVKSNGTSIDDFPINLALLELKRPESCEKHHKEIEGYCRTDDRLICVTCILEDGHKSHEIQSLAKAAATYRKHLRNYEQVIDTNQEFLATEQASLKTATERVLSGYEDTQKEVKSFYQDLLAAIAAREQECMEALHSLLQIELTAIKEREQAIPLTLGQIDQYKQEAAEVEQEGHLDTIIKHKEREALAREACTRQEFNRNPAPFAGISVDQEAEWALRYAHSVARKSFVAEPDHVASERSLKTNGKRMAKRRTEFKNQQLRRDEDDLMKKINKKIENIELFSSSQRTPK